jgi:hypothetical protein
VLSLSFMLVSSLSCSDNLAFPYLRFGANFYWHDKTQNAPKRNLRFIGVRRENLYFVSFEEGKLFRFSIGEKDVSSALPCFNEIPLWPINHSLVENNNTCQAVSAVNALRQLSEIGVLNDNRLSVDLSDQSVSSFLWGTTDYFYGTTPRSQYESNQRAIRFFNQHGIETIEVDTSRPDYSRLIAHLQNGGVAFLGIYVSEEEKWKEILDRSMRPTGEVALIESLDRARISRGLFQRRLLNGHGIAVIGAVPTRAQGWVLVVLDPGVHGLSILYLDDLRDFPADQILILQPNAMPSPKNASLRSIGLSVKRDEFPRSGRPIELNEFSRGMQRQGH